MDSPQTTKYQGRCHCGLFRFTLNIAPLTTLWTCNCSICSRNGYLWIHPVEESQLSITSGEEKSLHTYHFAMRGTTHLFCPECGSSVMARRRDSPPNLSLRINARMLENVNLTKIPVKPFSNSNGNSKRNSRDETAGSDLKPVEGKAQDENTLSTTKSDEEASHLKKYDGNCHCGKFKFSVHLPEFSRVNECGCGVCTLKGYLPLAPAPSENVTVTKGSIAKLVVYRFKGQEHHFCQKCGSAVMISKFTPSGVQEFAINARVLKNFDLSSLEIIPAAPSQELAHREDLTFPTMKLLDSEVKAGLVKYNGSCHCGAVTYALKTDPLEKTKIMSCNCSLCSRNADLFIYPPRSAVVVSLSNLTAYPHLSTECLHCFCKICGVSVIVQILEEPREDMKPVEMPINVRTIVGVQIDKLEKRYYDGQKALPLYDV